MIEFDVYRMGDEKTSELLDMMTELPDYYFDNVYFHLDGYYGKKIVHIVMAGSKRLIDEAKEVWKIEDPEEFYDRFRKLEVGASAAGDLLKISAEKGREVVVFVDKPLGSRHPEGGCIYPVNYGYVRRASTIYGEPLCAYILGVDWPVNIFSGQVIAVIHRVEEKTYRLVVAPKGMNLTDEEIERAIVFQEKRFEYEILR